MTVAIPACPEGSTWPWPLCTAEQFFRGLWDHITESTSGAARWVVDNLYRPFTDWFYSAFEAIWEDFEEAYWVTREWVDRMPYPVDRIFQFFAFPAGLLYVKVKPLFTWLKGKVDDGVSAISTALDGAANSIRQWVGDALAGVAGALGEGLQDFMEWVWSGLVGLWNSIRSGVEWFSRNVGGFFQDLWKGFMDQIQGWFAPASPVRELLDSAGEMIRSYREKLRELIESAYGSPVDLDKINDAAWKAAAEAAAVMVASYGVATAIDASHPLKEWGARDVVHTIMLWTAIDTAVRAPIEIMHEESFQEGLRQYFRRKYRLALPSIDMLREWYWRGLISETVARNIMERYGYEDDFINAELESWSVIPPLSDLIRFAVREAFPVPAGKPQFEELKKWARKRGLSDWWVERYWLAHFDRMPLTTAYENVWRGYMSMEEFERYLMLADIHPDDWRYIENVMYRPPTIREMGYGYDVGVYTRDDIKRFRMWGGLSPEDAEVAADALVLYRSEAEREAIRRELMYLYAYGKIDEDEFTRRLRELRTSEDKIPLWLERARLYKLRTEKPPAEREPRGLTGSEILRVFELGLRDESWARDRLREIGWTSERIDVEIERVKFELEEEKRKEREVKYKKLSISLLSDLFEQGRISEDELLRRIVDLGYSEEDARLIVADIKHDLEEKRRKEQEVKYKQLTVSMLTDLYELGRIGDAELLDRLIGLGYSREDAELVAELVRFDVERRRVEKKPTVTDLERFYEVGVYSIDEVYRGLLELGYPEEYARLKSLWIKVDVNVPYLRAMYRNGWIGKDALYEELLNLGLPEEKAKLLWATIVKYEEPARLEDERKLTKSEIVKGVKAGVITPEQAVSLLMDLGYEEWEAWYILAIYGVVEVGDPEGYWEMRRVTELYKKARGLPAGEVPQELIELEKEIRKLKDELERLKREGAPDTVIGRKASELAVLEYRMRQLIVTHKLG